MSRRSRHTRGRLSYPAPKEHLDWRLDGDDCKMACGEPHGILTRGQPHTWRVTCKLCENTRSYRALRRMEQERAFGVLADDLPACPRREELRGQIYEYMRGRSSLLPEEP